MVRGESAGAPTCIAAPFGGDIIAGGWQPTVWLSKEPPASAPAAFTRSRRENRELGIGPPKQGRMDTGLVSQSQYIAARPGPYPGARQIGAKQNSLLLRPAVLVLVENAQQGGD